MTLTIAPGKIEEVKSMVLGKEPFRVFRDEDFRRILNMEDGPGATPAEAKARAGRRR